MSASECINTLLGQYLERKGKEFRDEDIRVEFRIRKHLVALSPEWKSVSIKLKNLYSFSRSPVPHTPKGRQLNKSGAIRKKAIEYKGEFVVVYMESLFKIRKDFQNYEKGKEV